MAKFNMSIIALGLSGELKGDGIAANTLWPRTDHRHGGGAGTCSAATR